MTEHAKIRFAYQNSDGETEIESMWAIRQPEGYEIDNIPFYAKEVALGDVVTVEVDEENLLWFKALLRPSGHSTVQLWFAREEDVERTRDELKAMGCTSEVSDIARLVAVDIPAEVPYERVKAFLDAGEEAERFEYQEACLASNEAEASAGKALRS